MRRLMSMALAVCVLVLAGCQSEMPKKVVLKTLTGQSINLSKLNGQWLMINYWASWCEPCRSEIPALNAFAKTHKKVQLLAVNFDGVKGRALANVVKSAGIQYASLVDDPSEALGLSDLPGIPVTLVFNPEGVLVKKLFGPQTEKSLAAAVA